GLARALTTDGIDGQTIQLGTGRSESIAELFLIACGILGVDAQTVVEEARIRPDASEVLVLESDPTRARDLLGWQATTRLEDGIRATIEWLKKHPETGDVDRVQL